jgi:hypothetical protein
MSGVTEGVSVRSMSTVTYRTKVLTDHFRSVVVGGVGKDFLASRNPANRTGRLSIAEARLHDEDAANHAAERLDVSKHGQDLVRIEDTNHVQYAGSQSAEVALHHAFTVQLLAILDVVLNLCKHVQGQCGLVLLTRIGVLKEFVSVNDTWEWNGEFWTQMADIGPAARQDHALCFDSVRQTALLFGGLSGQNTLLGDTWSWNGEDWTQLDDSGPSARSGHAMVFDSTRGRAVLFGGGSATGVLNDTWEWDGQAWTQQQDTGPSPRSHHALAFDLVHNRVVLFGGNPGEPVSLGDTWLWDGSTWTQIATFGANPWVSTDVQIALFGGMDSSNAVFRETWVFDGKHWTHRQDIGPLARFSHAMS